MQSDIYTASVELHAKHGGKLETKSKIPLTTKEALSLAYTPGVAEVSRRIATDPSLARSLTLKGNTIAVVTDGSAILGLGDLGPLAALPVMEGKAAIFKEFGGVDAFPICLTTQDPEEIIAIVKNIAPTFGGINLEDISAPKCFMIEERLRAELPIPVMHDDQWGAATVTLSALINALSLRGLTKEEARVVVNGVGAAGVAIGRLLHVYGIVNTIFCDSKGIIHAGRSDLTKEKKELLDGSALLLSEGSLADALAGAHVFIGVSKAGALTQAMVRTMALHPIIFGLANPTPEIMPDEAKAAGAFIVATGRSDFPNQINNSLVFPGAFQGMLRAGIPQFSNAVFIRIAEALARSVNTPSPEKILPSMFDEGVVALVSETVQG
ncbi:MAG: NADP-dependent malic enzyme [Candidatus Pacebacteria bacterium]|jgi:malate dehydrogenase (oxaloacetate-decarboxylating)|nr:NADP-dependent malic enzyme [Candidatus Paceibacterota bacterium]